MDTKRVFIIWTNPLFHASVVLLLNNPNIEVVGSTSDYASARKEITKHEPDMVLFEKTGAGIPTEVLEVLENSSWAVRVYGLSLDDNELSVYHRERQIMGQAGDLLRIIQNDAS